MRRSSIGLVLVLASSATVAAAPPHPPCVIESAPVAAPSTARPAPCRRPTASVAKAVRKALAARFEPMHGGKAEVTFACDGLGRRIREIILETGSGHGRTLAMWRAVRRSDGSYDVRGIAYHDGANMRPRPSTRFKLASGVVTVSGLASARAALSAQVREVVPPSPPGTIGLGKLSMSSRDFHTLVKLIDDDGRVLERRFTGYAGSSDQTYLGIKLAIESLAAITSPPAVDRAVEAEDRALFTARFNAAVPHFDDQFYWWVMERYVDLARDLGTPSTIAGLLTRLSVSSPERSKVDARDDAVDALSQITGWDARVGAASVEDAAARYLAECAPAAP